MTTQAFDLVHAKVHLSELIDRAQAGEEVIITRDDEPVAKLVAIAPTPHFDVERRRAAIAAIEEPRVWPEDRPITAAEIVSWIREGRE